MGVPLISAVLIVRDEQDHLPDCLRSLDGVVGEVVVLDTGSTDATVSIAEQAGARVFHRAWTDDFSAARNAAVAEATGAWILWIDADERIVSVDPQRLASMLDYPFLVGATVLLRPYVGSTRYRELRLFRNDPRLRFSGQIHEDVWTATQALAAEEDQLIVDVDLAIDHLGYEGDQTDKHRRNLPLLQARLRDEPDNVYCLHHLGVVLDSLGDPDGAVRAWERAIEIGRPDDVAPTDWLAYRDLVVHRARTGQSTTELLDRAAARFGDLVPLRSLRAELCMASGDHAGAVPDLEALVALDEDDLDGPLAYSRRLCRDLSWARLGICRFQMGAYAEAATAFEQANLLHPSTEYQTRLALARARAVAEMPVPDATIGAVDP